MSIFSNWFKPTCHVKVEQGSRKRWRWQAYDDNRKLIAVSPVHGFKTYLDAEIACNKAMRGWKIKIEVEQTLFRG